MQTQELYAFFQDPSVADELFEESDAYEALLDDCDDLNEGYEDCSSLYDEEACAWNF
jgi:hypothetical protein